MPDRFARWSRERELSSDKRAGSWARGQVHRKNWAFLKRNWLYLSLLPLLTVAVASLMLLVMPDWSRMFIAGALIATGFWLAAIAVLVGSGSACLMMGEVAEQWTAQELRPFRRCGWKIINRMLIKRWDIDHVAVGAPGVVVVETKWTGGCWNVERADDRLLAAVCQTQDNARDARLFLGSEIAAPIRAAVVLWSAEPLPDHPCRIDGVDVVPGSLLSQWFASLDGEVLGPDEIDAVWRRLEGHLSRRDANELERTGPPPRGVSGAFWQGWTVLMGVVVGMLTSTALLSLLGGVLGVLATASVLLGLGCAALRSPKLRAAALGWLGGTQFVTVAVVGAVLFDWLR